MTTSGAGQTNAQTTTTTKKLKETHLQRPSSKHETPFNPIRCAREHSVPRTACLAPCSRFVALEVQGYPARFATSTANSSLDIPCKQVEHVNHYHAAGGGHRRRNGRYCRNFFRYYSCYHRQRVQASSPDTRAVCLGRRGGALSLRQTSLSPGTCAPRHRRS